MKLFTTKNIPWWQIGIIKFAVLCFGLAIGAYWPQIFSPYLLPLLILGALFALYSFYLWMRD